MSTDALAATETTTKPDIPVVSPEENIDETPELVTNPGPTDSHDEEYESADEDYEVEEIEIEEEVEEEEDEEEYDEDRATPQDSKELDDDEDVKNPQFIPKKGYFYEHDDRTRAEDVEETEEPKKEEKKKPATKDPDRWTHDLYNEDEQAPKTKEELERAYGYEIWKEDQAPRARRRRRYGRGPNKYTRHWEEEEAYRKPRGGGAGGGGFRGRGRGRGGFQNSGRRRSEDSSKNFDSEFPALPETTSSQAAPIKYQNEASNNKPKGDSYRRPQNPPRDRHPGGRNMENERNGAFSRGNPRGGRGRGRRNEFSNRNRYPGRAEDERRPPTRGNESNKGAIEPHDREKKSNLNPSHRNNASANVSNGHVKSLENSVPSKPPFTNTEYTGSHSLTAIRSDDGKVEVKDAREIINARRAQQKQQQQQVQAETGNSDKNSVTSGNKAVPPQPQAPQAPPQPIQVSQQPQGQTNVEQVSAKPKRFSAQRQRAQEQQQQQILPVNQGPVVPNSVGIPTSVATIPHSHVPASMIPVATGTEQLVPSPVPAYPQAQTFYDGPQVYEASGSPVSVATVTTNGNSVSPSLWASHAYANAPYPSPPTGPQVPQQAYADHAAYMAAQQTGPIYQAPPQFIQDPNMINYPAAAPPFPPPFHPQGYQGYPQVTPAPPPELYHGGVTYYNPTPQIQRQPMMPQKRTKTVLQLVEPPEKSGKSPKDPTQISSDSPPVCSTEAELCENMEDLHVHGIVEPHEEARQASPSPPEESWSSQMEQISNSTNDQVAPQGKRADIRNEEISETKSSPLPEPSSANTEEK